MKAKTPTPPLWAQRFLKWYCKPRLHEDLSGDLHEFFDRNVRSKGPLRARLIYVLDVIKFLRLYTIRKPETINILIHYIMLGSYIKTSGRNMLRNRLFSTINIVGLAISMSVGLLVIAFITDLKNYDAFQENHARMYRITSIQRHLENPPVSLASTSVAAGKKLSEEITGIEHLTLMRRGFQGDASVNDKILPITGFWADENFFKVFSFKLLNGKVSSALKEPYSIVLTEKTADKLFGSTDALGKTVRFDSTDYVVTGILQNIPDESHLRFESLVSFSTVELQQPSFDGEFNSWDNVYSNYVYFTLPPGSDPGAVQEKIDALCQKENKKLKHSRVDLRIQASDEFVVGPDLSNPIGPTMHPLAIYILIGLAGVVILSACLNYTNLSVARSLRRSKEVGIRKVIGALRGHVLSQFIAESIIIALLALVFSFCLFIFLRHQLKGLDPYIENLVSLQMSPRLFLYFLLLAVAVGLVAGFLPAWFYSRINASQVLKDASSLRVFKRINLRKALIVLQYTVSLIFITTTIIAYNQYKGFLTFDLGFKTENIVNIRMQGNKDDVFINELKKMSEVSHVSRSRIVTSVGNMYGAMMRNVMTPHDSAVVWMNFVDENYLPLHGHQLIAGENFTTANGATKDAGVILNENALKQFDISGGDPQKAVGEQVIIQGRRLTVKGVLKDFHYGTVESQIVPVAFQYSESESNGYLNVKLVTGDLQGAMAKLEDAWKKIDSVHPIDAVFYDESIQRNYNQFSVMIRVMGFMAFLAVSIASMGLFGMVVFSTERRLKEISIRKVLGASEFKLIFLLSKGFLWLLVISGAVALPLTYLFFENVVLVNFAFHQPITVTELFVGMVCVLAVAMIMIGSQTLRVARANPADVLKSE